MLPGTFAGFLMDALLTHLWAMLAHPLHGHMPLRAGFLARSLVQDKAPFTRLAVGGISFTFSARGATAFAYAAFCIEAPEERRESCGEAFQAGKGFTPGDKGVRAENEGLLLTWAKMN